MECLEPPLVRLRGAPLSLGGVVVNVNINILLTYFHAYKQFKYGFLDIDFNWAYYSRTLKLSLGLTLFIIPNLLDNNFQIVLPICLFVGWFVGWLVACLVCWFVGCLLACCLVGCLVGCFI